MIADASAASPNNHETFRRLCLPLLCDKSRARAEWGNVGITKFYELVQEHGVALVKIGAKTAITGEDVARVANAIIAASKPAPIDAKALAKRSVASRQAARLAAAKSPPPRRTRRGSHAL